MIKNIINNKNNMFFLIAGPCVIENESQTYEIAERILEITKKNNIPFIFKASYKKANRSRLDSFTGIGDIKGLEILNKISKQLNIPVTTDVHNKEEVRLASEYVQIIQIPAFLCRQTDILIEAGKTNSYVNIKKGQFCSAESVKFMIEKITSQGNEKVIVTERGNSFGYQDLIVDIRNIPIMKSFGKSVVLDVTHSLQKPNQGHGVSGGNPEFIESLACAGIANNVNGLFLETHPNPKNALSDGSTMLPLNELEKLLLKLKRIRRAII
tara:strand:+ start:783 stop:1586 length:804 start_codon:yes stop_codon:yes gene_type:complete